MREFRNLIIFNVLVYTPLLLRGNYVIVLLLFIFYLIPFVNAFFLTKYAYDNWVSKNIKNKFIAFILLVLIILFAYLDFISSPNIFTFKEITLNIYLLILLKVSFYNIPFLNQLKSIVFVFSLSAFLFLISFLPIYFDSKFVWYLTAIIFVLSSHFNLYISLKYFTKQDSDNLEVSITDLE